MATVTRYINTGSTSGGDGTTNGTTGATRAYATMSEWEVNEQTNLVTAGDVHVVHCEGSTADTSSLTIDGFTTSATNHVEITVDTGVRHSGIWDTGSYRLVVNVNFDVLIMNDENIYITGIQIHNTHTSPSGIAGALENLKAGGRVSHCIFRGGRYTVALQGGDTDFFNNIMYGALNGGGGFLSQGGTHSLYSCTSTSGTTTYGIRQLGGTITAKNCYAAGSSGSAYAGTITKTTCASSDTTGSSGLQSIALSTTNFVNVTAGSEDFTTKSGSSLIGGGTDTSGEAAPLDFTDDIIGTARGTTWDVSAFELVTAGGGANPHGPFGHPFHGVFAGPIG